MGRGTPTHCAAPRPQVQRAGLLCRQRERTKPKSALSWKQKKKKTLLQNKVTKPKQK